MVLQNAMIAMFGQSDPRGVQVTDPRSSQIDPYHHTSSSMFDSGCQNLVSSFHLFLTIHYACV